MEWKRQAQKMTIKSWEWRRFMGRRNLVIDVVGGKASLVFSGETLAENDAIVPKMKPGDDIHVWFVVREGKPSAIVGLDHMNKKVFQMSDRQIIAHLKMFDFLSTIPGVQERGNELAREMRS